jgi:hypothetical protein
MQSAVTMDVAARFGFPPDFSGTANQADFTSPHFMNIPTDSEAIARHRFVPTGLSEEK